MSEKSVTVNLVYTADISQAEASLTKLKELQAGLGTALTDRKSDSAGNSPPAQGNTTGGGTSAQMSIETMLHRVGRSQQIYDQAIINVLQKGFSSVVSAINGLKGQVGGGGGGGPGAGGDVYQRHIAQLMQRGQATSELYQRHMAQLMRGGKKIGGDDSELDDKTASNISLLSSLYLARQAGRAVMHMASSTSDSISMSQRGDMTDAQRMRGVLTELPAIGIITSASLKIAEAIDGTTEVIRAATARMQFQTVVQQTGMEVMSKTDALLFGRSQAVNRVAALSGVQATTLPAIDRSTFAGEIAFQEASRRAPLLQARNIAIARNQAATSNVDSARASVQEIESKLGLLYRQRDAMSGNFSQLMLSQQNNTDLAGAATSGGLRGFMAANVMAVQGLANGLQSQAPLHGQGTDLMLVHNQIAAAEAERIQRLQRLTTAISAQGASEAQVRRANINLMREDLNVLQQREQRMSQGASSLAMMHPGQRRVNINALRQLSERGFDATPWFQREQAAQLAPDYVRRLAEQSGQNSPDFEFMRRIGAFGGGPERNLDEIRASMSALIDRINFQELRTEQQLATIELKSIDATLKLMLEAIRSRAGAVVGNAAIGPIVQNAAGVP